MRDRLTFLALPILCLMAPAVQAAPADKVAPANRAVRFSSLEAEHLINRAGFGGRPEEIEALVNAGLPAAVKIVLEGRPASTSNTRTFVASPRNREALKGLTDDERRAAINRIRREDRKQHDEFRAYWITEMATSDHPLQEKMALFWHGYFTSSQRDVRNSAHMIQQIELFREEGLGNYRDLVHAVAKDPAMLAYLDNDQNRKGRPNENFARELLELFTLGVGNYTEQDIKEAARAFTGWTHRDGEYVLVRRLHDGGKKHVLGHTGNFGGEEVIDIALSQPAAPRFLARRLLGYLVGPGLTDEMIEDYAGLLREHDWELRPVLTALFSDPRFYDGEIIGSRILGPVEYLVAICRRLGDAPPGAFLAQAADGLGQSLLNPPDVKGWDGGEAWITTSSFLLRANVAAYLIEGFDASRIRKDFSPEPMNPDSEMTMEGAGEDGSAVVLAAARRRLPIPAGVRWTPSERIRWLLTEEQTRSPEGVVDALCDRFLGVPVTPEARASLLTLMKEYQDEDGAFTLPSEAWLGRLVHIVLSLPEAHLG